MDTQDNTYQSVQQTAVGIDSLTDFWTEKYLEEYIAFGGSKMKFVTGCTGSGKTFFLRVMQEKAKELGYRVASFSAHDVWLHDFKEIYVEVLRQCDIMECLKGCSRKIIENMGYAKEEIPSECAFIDFLAKENMSDALNRREIRMQLKQMFLDNPLLDNNFALACSMLTGSILGYPILEEQNKELLLSWLEGDRQVKLAQLRMLGLSPSKITKYNARHMLRSLAEVIRLGGYTGLLICVDDMEILISKSSLEPLHYTKMKREDTYECFRQLIDDIDSLHHVMFVCAFDRGLMDDENMGIKSYQALWMRIQNEIVGTRFNRFTDIVDMDRFAAQEYTPQVIMNMSEAFARSIQLREISPIDEKGARALLEQVRLGGVGVPGLLYETMVGGEQRE